MCVILLKIRYLWDQLRTMGLLRISLLKKWKHCLKWSPSGGLYGGKIF